VFPAPDLGFGHACFLHFQVESKQGRTDQFVQSEARFLGLPPVPTINSFRPGRGIVGSTLVIKGTALGTADHPASAVPGWQDFYPLPFAKSGANPILSDYE